VFVLRDQEELSVRRFTGRSMNLHKFQKEFGSGGLAELTISWNNQSKRSLALAPGTAVCHHAFVLGSNQ
jgi:hypothetical protein